jgi:uncharacterized protein YkwD/ribosomal protein L37AE/L43A
MSEEIIGVCPECATKHFDHTPKSLYVCEYCGRSMCRVHKDARLVHIRALLGEYKNTKWGRAILTELQKKNGHPCFQYTHIFWKNFDAQNKKEFALRKKALGYLTTHPSLTKPPETSIKEKMPFEQEEPNIYTSEDKTSRLGLCPQCNRYSDKIVDYNAKTITFQCERCGFKFSQLKATRHDYVEPPEKPEPIEKSIPIKIEPTIKKKHFPLKKIIALLTIAIIIGVAIWSVPQFFSSDLDSSAPPNSSTSPLPNTTPPNTLPETTTHEELVNYALSLINSDRQSRGLQNVTLSSVDSGQLHAENMLKNNFFSHWDTNGYKPYMRYTIAGGKGSVSENCAAQLGFYSNLKEAIEEMEWRMMYDDADSDWGHRDNILDPLHNRVSIGIAFDNNDIYLVQDFEDVYVSWSTLSLSNQVIMQGTILKAGESISQVAIYFDNPTPLTTQQLENPPYNGGYDAGIYVGMVVSPPPSGSQYLPPEEGILIIANTWSEAGQNFNIRFDMSTAFAQYGKGVYTLYLWTNSDEYLTSFSIWN